MAMLSCPKCGASGTQIARKGTFKRVYPNWRNSEELALFDAMEKEWCCTNCGKMWDP